MKTISIILVASLILLSVPELAFAASRPAPKNHKNPDKAKTELTKTKSQQVVIKSGLDKSELQNLAQRTNANPELQKMRGGLMDSFPTTGFLFLIYAIPAVIVLGGIGIAVAGI